MSAHTPGPWLVDEARGTGGVLCFLSITGSDETTYRGSVASVTNAEHINGITWDEARANARLIAAAPALLRELKHAAALLAEAAEKLRTVDLEGDRFDLLVEAERFDSLVAQATGEQA